MTPNRPCTTATAPGPTHCQLPPAQGSLFAAGFKYWAPTEPQETRHVPLGSSSPWEHLHSVISYPWHSEGISWRNSGPFIQSPPSQILPLQSHKSAYCKHGFCTHVFNKPSIKNARGKNSLDLNWTDTAVFLAVIPCCIRYYYYLEMTESIEDTQGF